MSMLSLWQRISRQQLVRNTTWALLAKVISSPLQLGSFVLIARGLGTHGYGQYAAALAIVHILTPFASLGSGNVLVQHVARDPKTFHVYWGNALLTTFLSASFLSLLTPLLTTWLIPSLPVELVVLVALAEFYFAIILENCRQTFQAFERIRFSAQLELLLHGARFSASAIFFLSVSGSRPQLWAAWYLGTTALASVTAFLCVQRHLGSPSLVPSLVLRNLRDGLYFSVLLSSRSIYQDIDKALLVRLDSTNVSGFYASACRVVTMAHMPVRALLFAVYPRWFRQGTQGLRGTIGLAGRLLPYSLTYSLIAGLTLFLLAPVMPLMLGREFDDSSAVVRFLFLVPLLQTLHYLAADSLSGAGYHGVRTVILISGAILNAGLNLWLIPRFSWYGSAWTTLITHTTLAVSLWVSVWYLTRRHAPHP